MRKLQKCQIMAIKLRGFGSNPGIPQGPVRESSVCQHLEIKVNQRWRMSFKYLALQMVNCFVNPFFMLECVGVLLETLRQITINL